MKKVLIDTDPGMDDALAIILAAKSPAIELLGISSVAGNYPIEAVATAPFPRGCRRCARARCRSSRRPCWDWEHEAVSAAPPPTRQRSCGPRPMHAPSVLVAAPDQCIARQSPACPTAKTMLVPKERCHWQAPLVASQQSLLSRSLSLLQSASLRQIDRELDHKITIGNRKGRTQSSQ